MARSRASIKTKNKRSSPYKGGLSDLDEGKGGKDFEIGKGKGKEGKDKSKSKPKAKVFSFDTLFTHSFCHPSWTTAILVEFRPSQPTFLLLGQPPSWQNLVN